SADARSDRDGGSDEGEAQRLAIADAPAPGSASAAGAAVSKPCSTSDMQSVPLSPNPVFHWTGLGLAAGMSIGLARLAVVAAVWPHSGPLISYFALGCVNTIAAGVAIGAVIGLTVRRG